MDSTLANKGIHPFLKDCIEGSFSIKSQTPSTRISLINNLVEFFMPINSKFLKIVSNVICQDPNLSCRKYH